MTLYYCPYCDKYQHKTPKGTCRGCGNISTLNNPIETPKHPLRPHASFTTKQLAVQSCFFPRKQRLLEYIQNR